MKEEALLKISTADPRGDALLASAPQLLSASAPPPLSSSAALPLSASASFPWLFSARTDLTVFLGSAMVSLLALWIGARAGVLYGDAPDWAWSQPSF